MQAYRVRARNTAPESENRIHDDQTAAAHGFSGGLVPGVTVYGYLTVPVVATFGMDWLAKGGMRVRFLQPVYEGDELDVTLAGEQVEARRGDGVLCATGMIDWLQSDPPDLTQYPEAPLPETRPPASPESLAPGRTLGAIHADLVLPDLDFLARQSEALPVYYDAGVLHPAALLTHSNHLLMQNVVLGPWIHVASELRNFSVARSGERLALRGRVAECFERKGHRFVVLDIVAAVGERMVQQVRHTAIYGLRARPASPVSLSSVRA